VLRNKPSTTTGLSLKCRCAHPSLAVVFTELGCHARCRSCRTVGPERPSSEAARKALRSGNAGGRYYWQK
jgi:hypothetical protein